MAKNPIVFREYAFQPEFPFIYMKSTTTAPKTAFIHFHDCIELAILEKGYMIWNIENNETRIVPGTICIVPPHFTHTSWLPPDQSGEVLCHYLFFRLEELLLPYFPIGMPQDILLDCYFAFPHILDLTGNPSILMLLNRIIQEYHKENSSYQQEICAILQYLLIQYWRNYRHLSIFRSDKTHDVQMPATIAPALAYVELHYQQDIPSFLLAQLCNIPEAQFLKFFKKTVGKSLSQYIRQVKIQHACIILISTEEVVLEIAYAVGFSSLVSFNRAFSDITGTSPSVFRNELRNIKKQAIQYLPYPQ